MQNSVSSFEQSNDAHPEVDSSGQQNNATEAQSQKINRRYVSKAQLERSFSSYLPRCEEFILSQCEGIDKVNIRLRIFINKVLLRVLRIEYTRPIWETVVDSSFLESLIKNDNCFIHHTPDCFCAEYRPKGSQGKRTFDFQLIALKEKLYSRNVGFDKLSENLIRWRKTDLDMMYELSKRCYFSPDK